MNVLLVEPDAVLAKVYCQVLEHTGHTVVHAASAQAAVHAADTHRPDVVVLELQLPRHNGVEFLYEFRSYPEWLNIPVVLHTFVPENELAGMETLKRELGVCYILYKPAATLGRLCAVVQAARLQRA